MLNKTNEGYTLQDSISIAGSTYVLGHNPDERQSYVTWAQGPTGGYAYGNYFSSLELARQDLFRRAVGHLPAEDRTKLIQSLVTEEIRNAIVEQGREEVYLSDIESCLSKALTHLGIKQSVLSVLMDNPEFQARALHVYHRQDHSYDNEALTESLETLLHSQYPDLLPKEFTAVLKISPEELEVQKDVFNLTLAELEQKYGAIDPGEGMLGFFQQIKSPQITVNMEIRIFPKTTSETENRVEIILYENKPIKTWTRLPMGEATLTRVDGVEQIYSCTDKTGITWRLDLHADERLRRTGQQYIFRTDSDDPIYEQHNGQPCTVERQLTEKEADILCGSMMWKIRFDDDIVLDAFDYELSLTKERCWDLEKNPEQHPPINPKPLAQKIATAQTLWNEQIETVKQDNQNFQDSSRQGRGDLPC